MCLALTGRVIAVDAEGVATVDVDGRSCAASRVLVPEAGPGDWVTIGAGWILARLTADEAAVQRRLETGGRHAERPAN
jgi:hydrogenase maturation factor